MVLEKKIIFISKSRLKGLSVKCKLKRFINAALRPLYLMEQAEAGLLLFIGISPDLRL